MEDEVTYIGNFDEEDISNRPSLKRSSNKDNNEKFKVRKRSIKVDKFIASTKKSILNKKAVAIILIALAIYIVKPIAYLREKLDEKREYYSQYEAISANGIIDSITYATGANYYKNCRNTMVMPADGSITCCYDLAHKGLDIACDEYQGNIYAAACGYVVEVGYSQKYGNEILIEHEINGMKIYTYYANLSVINVSEGDYVYQNQVIALEGGNPEKAAEIMDTDGHHLHFEVRKSEKSNSGLNPIIFID